MEKANGSNLSCFYSFDTARILSTVIVGLEVLLAGTVSYGGQQPPSLCRGPGFLEGQNAKMTFFSPCCVPQKKSSTEFFFEVTLNDHSVLTQR